MAWECLSSALQDRKESHLSLYGIKKANSLKCRAAAICGCAAAEFEDIVCLLHVKCARPRISEHLYCHFWLHSVFNQS